MSTIDLLVHGKTTAPRRQAIAALLVASALQAALTIGHFVYGAHRYADAGRLHVVAPAAVFLALTGALGLVYDRRPAWWSLAPLVAVAGGAFVALFGGFHGGFYHLAKLAFWIHGAGEDQLTELFDSPDFTMPDDVLFEATGLAAVLVAVLVAGSIVRLVRLQSRGA